jgi:hypothetical protein
MMFVVAYTKMVQETGHGQLANQAAAPEGLNTEQTERMMTKNSGLAAAVLYVRHAWL